MVLRLHNTLTGRPEIFIPRHPPAVSIYCCGVTVYDACHLGHARSYIVWDLLRRYLRWQGFAVRFIQNFTDIDDKIIQRAQAEGSSVEAVTERNITGFFAEMDALNVLRADDYPRATRCLDRIQAMITRLEAKGAAYSADGDVYFAVMKAQQYGKLSGRDLQQQQEGASGRLAEADTGDKNLRA
ncbi:class I tRNA ligase family protein, partial [Candidatus Synechococcus spongiarum]